MKRVSRVPWHLFYNPKPAHTEKLECYGLGYHDYLSPTVTVQAKGAEGTLRFLQTCL